MVEDNREQHRFELEVDGRLAVAVYRRAAGVVTFTHTEVPPELGGHGIGSRLARGALELVRQSGDKIIARCPFIAAFVQKHPEFQDLLADAG
ncbi:MAG: GNAT family N-acetyltransferase [Polyangiaceae bacterium]